MVFKVRIDVGTTIHRLVVRARSHVEAFLEACEVLHVDHNVDATITPMIDGHLIAFGRGNVLVATFKGRET